MHCPESYITERLLLRRPTMADAESVFSTYAGDPEVGHYLAWPIHETIADTRRFLASSEMEWREKPGGPYLIWDGDSSTLIGSTGLAFESEDRASTGYVIAKRYWGQGFATEALRGVTEIAAMIRLARLYALCHPDHVASQRVLKKCGFRQEDEVAAECVFPNQGNDQPQPVLSFAWRQSG
jgi:ribosomal-protein-alanine N-acetyltransferase